MSYIEHLIEKFPLGQGDLLRHISIPKPAHPAILALLKHNSPTAKVLVGVPTKTEAESLTKELQAWLGEEKVALLPAWETLPFERVSPSIETMGKRLAVLSTLGNPDSDSDLEVVVASTRALLQQSPSIESLRLKLGEQYNYDQLIDWLSNHGYRREIQVSARGEMAIRGGIVDVFPSASISSPRSEEPLRIEFFGNTIDSMRAFSLTDQLATGEISHAQIFPAREFIPTPTQRAKAKELAESLSWGQKLWGDLAEGIFFEGMESWMSWLADEASLITDQVADSVQIVWVGKNEMELTATKLRDEEQELSAALMEAWGASIDTHTPSTVQFESMANKAHYLIDDLPNQNQKSSLAAQVWGVLGSEAIVRLKELLADGFFVSLACWSEQSAKQMEDAILKTGTIDEDGVFPQTLKIHMAPITQGCIFQNLKLAILPENLITQKHAPSTSTTVKPAQAPSSAWLGQLVKGTFVVHQNHGVGRYMGTQFKVVDGTEREYLLIEYKGNDRLYLPAEQIGLLSLYSVGETPRLNSLGGSGWKRTQSRAKAEAKEIAKELVELYGERNTIQGYGFEPDSAPHQDLAATFPYLETPDQMNAILNTAADMEKPIPMDRLIYGDVGFGKTEIAVRAAFKAIVENKQAAILVPTTLLARQHLQTFSERYANFPIRMEMLSRLVPAARAREIAKELAAGEVDLVIGTHRMLSKDVHFKDLGLLIIDEEQRFGVKQKEKIKSLHKNVDILTLTATPIPRTLEMSLTGIRDYNIIKTPPLERHSILTYVGSYDQLVIKEAIRRELLREGQVFFVHNRIGSITQVHKELRELVPSARIAVAHGRMNELQLEQAILDFTDKKYDVLLCTTIIEAGIDMPQVNTLVVDRAERLGLGQLHQLRGRVGRAGTQAYAYLLSSPDVELSPEATERLRTIGEITALGSGFHLAMRDLEIRGAGNLLGFGQSGHIASVGYDMYCDLVNSAVMELKGKVLPPKKEVIMDLPIEAHLPDDFVEDETLRLDAYRKLFLAGDNEEGFEEIQKIGEQWRDRFGPLPAPAQYLLAVAKIRLLSRQLGLEQLSVVEADKKFLKLAPISQSLLAQIYESGKTAKDELVLELSQSNQEGDQMLVDAIFNLLTKLKAEISSKI